jgi:DNA-binding Xre family transcriptional regulator
MVVSGLMMRLLVREVAEARGIRNAKDLADRTRLSYSIIYPIWHGITKRIDLSTLERLCKTLKATPGLLIHYEPEQNSADVPVRAQAGAELFAERPTPYGNEQPPKPKAKKAKTRKRK